MSVRLTRRSFVSAMAAASVAPTLIGTAGAQLAGNEMIFTFGVANAGGGASQKYHAPEWIRLTDEGGEATEFGTEFRQGNVYHIVAPHDGWFLFEVDASWGAEILGVTSTPPGMVKPEQNQMVSGNTFRVKADVAGANTFMVKLGISQGDHAATPAPLDYYEILLWESGKTIVHDGAVAPLYIANDIPSRGTPTGTGTCSVSMMTMDGDESPSIDRGRPVEDEGVAIVTFSDKTTARLVDFPLNGHGAYDVSGPAGQMTLTKIDPIKTAKVTTNAHANEMGAYVTLDPATPMQVYLVYSGTDGQ